MIKAAKVIWPSSSSVRFTIVVLILFIALSCLAAVLWSPWLRDGATDSGSNTVTESNVDTLRSIGLLIGGVLALAFGVWRAWVAEHQIASAEGQLKAAREQVAISQQSSLNDTYQRSAEMLGSNVLAVRLGGIYALQYLADEYPKQYHLRVINLLCAYVRNPTPVADPLAGDSPRPTDIYRLREDVQAAMNAIGYRSESGLEIELLDGYRIDISGAVLNLLRLERGNLRCANMEGSHLENAHIPYIRFDGANLINTNLTSANLRFANLNDCDLSYARLWKANLARAELTGAKCYETTLTDAVLRGARLWRVDFHGAEVSAVDFSNDGKDPAEGLTQRELDATRRNVVRLPLLTGVLDPETGGQVVWISGTTRY